MIQPLNKKNGKANNHQGEFLEVPFHTIASVTAEGRSGVAGRAGIVSISIPSRVTGRSTGVVVIVVDGGVVMDEPGIKRLWPAGTATVASETIMRTQAIGFSLFL